MVLDFISIIYDHTSTGARWYLTLYQSSMTTHPQALEAQEAVDEATKLALQRVKMEAEVSSQH